METSASTSLQNLLDKTTKRLCLGLLDWLDILVEKKVFALNFVHKWGFDGATGQSAFKQKWLEANGNDAALFATNLVPLRLHAHELVVWNNPKPSSEKFCRPLRLQFLKESGTVNKEEEQFWKAQISSLLPTKVVHKQQEIEIQHRLIMTMIDGKVVSHLTDIHTTNCTLCGATPSMMNQLEVVKKRPVDLKSFDYGLSSMHLWIRLLDYMWNVAIKLPFQKGRSNKSIEVALKEREHALQEEMFAKLGLIINVPKSGGAGKCFFLFFLQY
eukprot:Pompholyxophrys_punicea_v1_NODE_541_length_1718_cov_135.763680.p1 type:complete len:271 gc:universal NODE_541_length_1718_cov_135.763680:1395-583(-)